MFGGSEGAIINANDDSAAARGFETKRAIMFLVADGRTRRMHTVPESYFEAFAVREPARRTSRLWRFERSTGESKLLGVGDAEITKDIYAVFNEDGTPDTGIEDELLCGLEGAFCTARNLLLQQKPLSKENWSSLFRLRSSASLSSFWRFGKAPAAMGPFTTVG